MTKHPHAAALKRIGHVRVQSHFNISRQAVNKWSVNGVPGIHQTPLRLLATIHGVPVPELNVEDEA